MSPTVSSPTTDDKEEEEEGEKERVRKTSDPVVMEGSGRLDQFMDAAGTSVSPDVAGAASVGLSLPQGNQGWKSAKENSKRLNKKRQEKETTKEEKERMEDILEEEEEVDKKKKEE